VNQKTIHVQPLIPTLHELKAYIPLGMVKAAVKFLKKQSVGN